MPGVKLPDLQHFPQELKALPNWVCWRYQERGGKRTKVPYSPRGGAAKSNDPSTWATLPEAQGAAERRQYDGIGFMFDGTCFGVDIDHCIDPDTGEITAEALAIAKALHSYTEFSPSGTGLHILCSGAIPTEGKRGRRKGAVEVYGKGRFFTVTGDPFGGEALPLADGTEAVKPILAAMDRPAAQHAPVVPSSTPATGLEGMQDGVLLNKMLRKPQLRALYEGDTTGYDSHSEADMALCRALAFWTGRDAEAMDRLFRGSGLMRDKWDAPHDGATGRTYGQMTIEKAIESTTEVYDPDWHAKKMQALAEEHEAALQPPVVSEASRALQAHYAELYSNVGYCYSEGGQTFAYAAGSIPYPLADFVCAPVEVITRDDGEEQRKEFVLEGVNARGTPLPRVTIPAKEFNSMGWLPGAWGVDANIIPGQTTAQKLRFAIAQAGQVTATRRTVYTHTGWRKINGQLCYLYQGGAIGADDVTVELPSAISGLYTFTQAEHDPVEAARASCGLLDAFPAHVSFPLLAHMYLAPLREFLHGMPPSFLLFLYGGTGTGKSTAAALFLTHYGERFSNRRLPASFADTDNTLRMKAFYVKDAPFLTDDFHPTGTLRDRQAMSKSAQALARSYGDGAQRGRLRADATLQTSKPPRGVGLFSGEDMPDVGQSGSARFFVVEVKPGDVLECASLSELQRQGERGVFAAAMMGYIRWTAQQAAQPDFSKKLVENVIAVRDKVRGKLTGSHARYAESVAHLYIGLRQALLYWIAIGAITLEDAENLQRRAMTELCAIAADNARSQREDDPVEMFFETLRELTASGVALLACGAQDDHLTSNLSCGVLDADYLYLLPNRAYGAVCEAMTKQGRTFPISQRALGRRMKERGKLIPSDKGVPSVQKRFTPQLILRVWKIPRDVWEPKPQQIKLEGC